MTNEVSHGAHSRRPVHSGNRRVRGLWERTRTDGTIVFEAHLWIDKRDKTIVLEATTKSEAIREIEALRVDRDRGERRHGSFAPTLAEFAAEWIEHLQAKVAIRDERRSYAQSTVDLYEQRLRDHVLDQLGNRRVDELSVDDLRRLVDRLPARGLAPGTVTSIVNIVSGLLRFAVKRKVVAHNVVRDLDRDDRPGTKRQSEPRYLNAVEIDQLLAQLSDTFRPVAVICVYAGLRISETLGLRWRDVDLKRGTITVSGQLDRSGSRWIERTKTPSSQTTLPVIPILARELAAHRSRQAETNIALVRADALVFVTARGKPQSRRNALRALHVAGKNAGLNPEGTQPVGLQDLRHSLVAIAFDQGLSVPEVTALARHGNPRVTLTVYAGLVDDGREKAVAKLTKDGFGA
jgi:integrase